MHRTTSLTIGVLFLALSTAACSIDINEKKDDDNANVDIRTPVGSVSVRTDIESPDTGLPVYPGAIILRDGDEPGSANVNIGAFGFGVKVAAARFESGDGQQAIVDFYKEAMTRFGTVTECRGDVDFPGRSGPPVCRESSSSREVQLAVGTSDNQHIVAIKPRGSGSEIGVAFVQTRGD